jgi:predicted enzyme related to lactoylglutathione lyase
MANPVVHFEVTGKDGKKLQEFYSKAFGWQVNADNPMNYGIVDAQEGGIAGGISAGDGGTRQVTFYIEVDDPQAYLDKVEAKGGKTVMPVISSQQRMRGKSLPNRLRAAPEDLSVRSRARIGRRRTRRTR